MSREEYLSSLGYCYYKGFDMHDDQARECVKELREQGYCAQVVSCGTRVHGIRNYFVMYKTKIKQCNNVK